VLCPATLGVRARCEPAHGEATYAVALATSPVSINSVDRAARTCG